MEKVFGRHPKFNTAIHSAERNKVRIRAFFDVYGVS